MKQKAAELDGETEMVLRKSNKKKGEWSKREEGQSALSVEEQADKEIELEYRKEEKTQDENCKEMERKIQTSHQMETLLSS